MPFFKRFQKQQPPSAIGGLIGYYRLTDWWMSTFTPADREHIEATYQPMGMRPGGRPLTQGRSATSQTVTDFLAGLASCFRKAEDSSIAQRIRAKIDELSQSHPVTGPGYYQGRHFTTYVEDVKARKRSGDTEGAEQLLLALLDATEAEGRAKKNWGVAPWYYEELAKIYRARKDYSAEVAILERYTRQMQGKVLSGRASTDALERLEKARALLAKSQGG